MHTLSTQWELIGDIYGVSLGLIIFCCLWKISASGFLSGFEHRAEMLQLLLEKCFAEVLKYCDEVLYC